MAAELPENTVQFGEELVDYEDHEGSGKVVLGFSDGSTTECDVGSSSSSHWLHCFHL
jgi:hypothetical protein